MNERERDAQRLWRDQPREEHQMSVEDIRSRAEQLEQRVRSINIATAALVAVVILVEAFQIWKSRELIERAGDMLTIAAFIYVAFRFRGHVTVQSTPAGLGRTSSAVFYREQLVRRRDLSSHPWRFLLPFVPGVALSLLGGVMNGTPTQMGAAATFGVALFVGVAWWERRRALRIQEEIDEVG